MKINLLSEQEEHYLARLDRWEKEHVPERLWNQDYTLWKDNKDEDKELSDRLGWLSLPSDMRSNIKLLNEIAEEIRKEFEEIVLLGMGGSSLAPEMLFSSFGKKNGYPSLSVLDSTHPDAVKAKILATASEKTLFVVSSKSGTTIETSSFMHTAYNAISRLHRNPGRNFIAITDPGTVLETFAKENKFRRIFKTPPKVGGRYSALTYFGMLPAVLIGIDIGILIERACNIMSESKEADRLKSNDGYKLGAALGELALTGKDKIILISSPGILSFPYWIEQLVAESTGKDGKGILPVIEKGIAAPDDYHQDNVVIYMKLLTDDDNSSQAKLENLINQGIPVIQIDLKDKYDLGYEFYRWELATAMASTVLKINPFDQPNVQLAKTLASEAINIYRKEGSISSSVPSLVDGLIQVYSELTSDTLISLFREFVKDIKSTDYVAIMAFVNPETKTDVEITNLKNILKDKLHTMVTTGYGPRFLHSTGQLHKGDSNKGFFIQLTSSLDNDIEVPGQGYSFGLLISAQAQGDLQALKNMGRRAIRFHFTGKTAEGINSLGKILLNL